MKSKQTLICAVIAVIAATAIGCFALVKTLGGDSHESTSDTNTGSSVSDYTSSTIGDTTIKPPSITEPTSEDEKDGKPKVESETVEDIKDKTPEMNDSDAEDKTESDVKDKDEQQIGENINDDTIIEKEENAPVTKKEEDKPVIVEDEQTSTEDESKGDAEIIDEDSNVDESTKDAPEYNPPIGGDNPFDDDVSTVIDDKPVEDYVSENENRPGEGIHF